MQGTPGASIVGGAGPALLIVTAPFNSPGPQQLAIDASAFVNFTGTGTFIDVLFEVLVDGTLVPGSEFGTRLSTVTPDESEEIGAFSSSTTLLVTVPAGAHVVALRWSSPNGSPLTTDTLIAANLRVLRLTCAT